ncbi:MAG: thermonuclease family protein [Prosthecobacter sp.]
MPFRTVMLNLSITAVLVLVIVLGGILLRESKSKVVPAVKVPVAGVPGQTLPDEGGVPKEAVDRFQILPSPALVESRANEADTLRIRYGNEEHIFVLYFADALETTMNHPQLVAEQGRYFGKAADKTILEVGNEAAVYVAQLLKDQHFNVLTKWERVPNTVRYYAVIKVQQPSGPVYLADLLIRKGYAWVHGIPTELPDDKRDLPTYVVELSTLAKKARESKAGIWSKVTN